MTSEPWTVDTGKRPPTPGPEITDAVLNTELEPTADGGQRALLYPSDCPGAELATKWLAAEETVLIDLADVR